MQKEVGLGSLLALLAAGNAMTFGAMLKGRIVARSTLDREVAAERRIAEQAIAAERRVTELHQEIAQAAKERAQAVDEKAQILAAQVPRMVDLLERMDAYVRAAHPPPVAVPVVSQVFPSGDGSRA